MIKLLDEQLVFVVVGTLVLDDSKKAETLLECDVTVLLSKIETVK